MYNNISDYINEIPFINPHFYLYFKYLYFYLLNIFYLYIIYILIPVLLPNYNNYKLRRRVFSIFYYYMIIISFSYILWGELIVYLFEFDYLRVNVNIRPAKVYSDFTASIIYLLFSFHIYIILKNKIKITFFENKIKLISNLESLPTLLFLFINIILVILIFYQVYYGDIRTGSIFDYYKLDLKLSDIILIILPTVIIKPFYEELFYRGVIQKTICRNSFMSIIITSFLFSICHHHDHLGYFIYSLIFGYCYYKYNSLIINILIHATINIIFSLPIIDKLIIK